jgi:hypothetical protein
VRKTCGPFFTVPALLKKSPGSKRSITSVSSAA